MVANGTAPKIVQPEEGATYDPMLNKKNLCQLSLDQSGQAIHNFIRGMDSSPGAWTILDGQEVMFLPKPSIEKIIDFIVLAIS